MKFYTITDVPAIIKAINKMGGVKIYHIFIVLITLVMLNSFTTLQLNSDAPSLHGKCDKPSGLGCNFMENITSKKCSRCKIEKPLADFYSNKAKPSGKYSECILCYKAKLKKWESSEYTLKVTAEQLEKETWKDIVISGEIFPYKISDCGRIFLNTKNRIAKPSLDNRGYPQIVLTNNGERISRRIHILVGHHYIPNPLNLPELNHIDGDKFNSHFSNLKWDTSKDNTDHAFKTGLRKPLTKSPNSRKVINTITAQIFESAKAAADSCGMSPVTMVSRLNGTTKNNTPFKYL